MVDVTQQVDHAVNKAMDSYLSWFDTATVAGISLANLSKFTGFLVAGLLLGRLVRIPVARWLEQITPENDHKTSVKISKSLEKSIFLLIFALVLKSGAIDVLHLPGWAWEKMQYAITILLSAASTMLFVRIVDMVLFGLRKKWADDKGHADDHLINFMRKGVRIFVILIAALVTADNIGFKVTGAIAGLGVGGAAIALGAQGLIANILGTIEVVADKLYHVGDRIQFEAFDGFVTDIGLRSTQIRAITGEVIHFPNKRMAEVQIRNLSRKGLVRTSTSVALTYATSVGQIHKAMEILEGIAETRKDWKSCQIFFKKLGDYSLDLEMVFWAHYTNSTEYNALMSELHVEIKHRFDEAKLDFAFPTQTWYVNAVK